MSDKPAYLVFDIETVVDGRLAQRIRFPDQPELTPSQAIIALKAQLLEQTAGKSDFIPQTFHVPVSIAVAKVASDFSLIEVRTLDRPRLRPQVLVRSFWKGWASYGNPVLVSFNGRGFDIPVLELGAFRYGVAVPEWFHARGPSYTHPRNRYGSAHLDLQDFLTNFGACAMHGGLNLCAQILGKPGKMETKGSMVQDLWEGGEKERIDDYCMCDVLDTYFVFLRTRVVVGEIDLAREQRLVESARDWIARNVQGSAALTGYLANFHSWRPVSDEDDPFLKVPAPDPV